MAVSCKVNSFGNTAGGTLVCLVCVCTHIYFPPFHTVLFLYMCSERYLIQDYDSLYSFLMKVGGAFFVQVALMKIMFNYAFSSPHRQKKVSLKTKHFFEPNFSPLSFPSKIAKTLKQI